MFDISARLVSEQDQISWVETNWLGKSFMETFCLWRWKSYQSSAHKGLRLFRFCIASWKGEREHPIKPCMGRQFGMVWNISGIQKLWQNRRRVNGIRVEFFPEFNTLQLSQEVKDLLVRLNETSENLTGRIIFMSMFHDISWGSKDNGKEYESNAQLVSLYAKKIWSRTMVISRSWFTEEVVFYQWR